MQDLVSLSLVSLVACLSFFSKSVKCRDQVLLEGGSVTWPVFHMALLQLDRFSKDNMVCKPVIPSQHDFADLCSIFVALSSDAYISL